MTPDRLQPRHRLLRTIASRFGEVDALCAEINALLKEAGLAESIFATELVVRECLNNAVVHGNKGDQGKQVAIDLRLAREWIRLRVTDEGAGFDWRRAHGHGFAGPRTPSGRGLWLIARFTDRFQYNRKGNQITLWLRRERRQTTCL